MKGEEGSWRKVGAGGVGLGGGAGQEGREGKRGRVEEWGRVVGRGGGKRGEGRGKGGQQGKTRLKIDARMVGGFHHSFMVVVVGKEGWLWLQEMAMGI